MQELRKRLIGTWNSDRRSTLANFHRYFRTAGRLLVLAALPVGLLPLVSCAPKAPANSPELTRFFKLKETQAHALALKSNSKMPAEAWALFDYLQHDQWPQATNTFSGLQGRNGRSGAPVPPSRLQAVLDTLSQAGQRFGVPPPKVSALQEVPWHAIVDAHWAYVLSKTWRAEPLEFITTNIARTVPPGAIFFGDSDPGRFALGRAMESRDPAKRFCVITQNQLADYSYWEYVQFLCSSNIILPSANDFNAAYSRYVAGAYGTGTVAVAALNAEFSRQICEQNLSHPIYMEASWFFPQWAYERAVPRGLVFEIRRESVPQLEAGALEADREFWSGVCKQFLGDEIRRDTSVEQLCEFVERVYLRKDVSGFKGDRKYVSDTVAQSWFGMARHLTAEFYQWRCIRDEKVEEKQRMLDECVFAYKQAFALSPMMSMDFAGLLSQIGRTNEATRISSVRAKIAARP